MNDILRVNNLAKRYPSFSLEGITLDLPAGYIMGLIGENGAGKTTLIRTILGMVQADEGTVELLGRPVDKEVLSQVGVVFDQSHLVEEWKVAEAEKALMAFYPQWDRETFRRCLERFAISPGKKVKELSRGMQTKLSLSMALSHGAELLILDEPTSGLDPVARDDLLELFLALVRREGRSILFSTHITSDLDKCADEITYLKDGAVLASEVKTSFLQHFSYLLAPGERGPLSLEEIMVRTERRQYDDI